MMQTEMQRFLMRNLLELECRFLLISRNGSGNSTHEAIDQGIARLSWGKLLESLNWTGLEKYMQCALERASGS